MPTHDTQPAGFQPPAAAPKVNPYAPRPFEVVESGQTSTNPFARRPHEVWTAEPPSSPTAPPEVQTQEEPQGVGTFWTEFRMNAPGTPPLPPPNLGRSGSVPAVQREPVTPEPYWYQGPPAQAMAAPVQESSAAAPSASGSLVQQQATGETETVPEPPGIGTFWTEFRMNAPGTPPMPPPNLGRSGRSPAIQRDPVTPEPYWYQGPPIQAKLTVGAPNDAYEQEADRVAAQVMTMPDPSASIQRQETPDIEEPEELPGLQTRAIADSITPLVQRQPDAIDEELVQPKCETCEQEEPIQRHLDGLASQPTLSEPQPTPDIQRDPSGMPPKKGTTQITKNSATLTASGKTITEAITNLTSQGKGEAGSVTCTPARDFKTYQADDKADPVVYEADVQVTETKAMPVWTELNQQCEPVKKEWTRFYGALDTHENGHISRDEKAFTNLHTKLLGKKEADANKTFNDTTTKADTDNAAYDTATQHGLTQGTAVTPVQCGPEKVSQNPDESGAEPLAQVESTPEPAVQTKPNRPRIQRRADGTSPVQPDLEGRLNGSKGGGSPLPSDVRSFMEPRFGADFSQVRVHTGSDAVQMNREVRAQAFTHGSDVYFGSGKSPGINDLTAHELTHVVQQTGAKAVQPKLNTVQKFPKSSRQGKVNSIPAQIVQAKTTLPQALRRKESWLSEPNVLVSPTSSEIAQRQNNKDLQPNVQMKCAACETEENIQPKSISGNITASSQDNKVVQKLSWDDVPGARWVGDQASAGAQWVGDKAGQAAAWGKEQFASLVAKVAPGLSNLIRQGPIGLLTDKIKEGIKGWLSGVVSGANIGSVVATLQGSFAQVFAGVQALGKGDPASCAAFAESIQKLRDLGHAFMNNPVVKQVQAAFAKVRGVFQKVTSAIVAPVFDTLMNVAGGVFNTVRGLATTIWEWGAPVRNTLGSAWNWVKEQLGIGGDGSEGVLGWLKTKASAAWTSIKTTFSPVIEPLKKVGMVLLAFSPVGMFAAISKAVPKLVQMGEWLLAHKGDKDIVKKAHQEMGNTILPQLLGAVQSLGRAVQSTATSLVNQVTQLSQSVLSLLGAISGVPLLSMAQSLVRDLSEKLQNLVSWGQDTFQSVAKSIQEAFTKIAAKIKPYAGILSSLVSAIVSPGMIPVILAGSAWRMLDDCYKPPIIDFLLDVVIGILQAAPTLPMFGLLWPMLKTGVLGFLQGVKAQPAATKVAVTNKLAKIISGGSPAFLLGFAKGLLKGIWEGLTDPFVLIYEGLKGLGNLTVWLNDTASAAVAGATAAPVAPGNAVPTPATPAATSNPPQNAAMGQRMQQMAGELQPPVDQVSQGFMPAVQAAFSGGEGLTFEQLMQKLGDAWGAVESAIQGAGSTLASKACEFMMQDGAEGEMGETVGWLAGTIAFEVALAALTAGGATAAKGAMKVLQTFAKILDWTGEALGLAFKALAKVGGYVLDAVKGIGKLLSKAGGAAKTLLDTLATIGRKLVAFADELLGLTKKVGKGAAGEVAEEAAEKTTKEAAEAAAEKTAKKAKEAAEAGAERGAKEGVEEGVEEGAEKTAKEGIDDHARGISKSDPSMQAEVGTADGGQLTIDFRKDLSGVSQGLVRKLEQQGFVRVDSIHPDDLVSLSKWFGKEIGVLQSPYHNGLRLVLGTENGVLKRQIRPGEVFVVHTHPVFRSQKSHFGVDIPNAGKHTEAVVDWSGQIIYFNKTGVLNPISPSGLVEPMPTSFQSAFMNAEGQIVGYAKIDVLVDDGRKTIVKVVE